MNPLTIFAFAIFLFTVPFFQNDQATKSIDDEYAVLSALVNDVYLEGDAKMIVITNPSCCAVSQVDSHTYPWKTYVEELNLFVDTLDDYIARNQQSLTFEKRFSLKSNYQIVPYVELEKLFDSGNLDDAWKSFYAKYPASNGYLRLSRVGFNKARDQAIVCTGWMRGPLYGEGRYIVLGKQNGSWKVLKKFATWMA